jgi:hypothetical protein
MGYLNNSTRTLDAILTKKGREILSSGGDFNVTKFALGDDEIDYSLWDTTHTAGTDSYGIVIDSLPALEPFNDPSEIMKYKLVTRTPGTRAMAKLIQDPGTSQSTLNNMKWYADDIQGDGGTRTQISDGPYYLGKGVQFGVAHTNNSDLTIDYVGGPNSVFYPPAEQESDGYSGEMYTLTLLDTTVAVLAPTARSAAQGAGDHLYPWIKTAGAHASALAVWEPYVSSVQHISQTIPGCRIDIGGEFNHNSGTQFNPGMNGRISLYPKKISANSSPAKTTLIITGQQSGAVFEYDVTITHRSTGTTPPD